MLNDEIILNPNYLTDLRRKLRRNSTEAERVLWQQLRGKKLGVRFYRQFGLRRYIVDFCCRSKRLVIEVDGEIHENSEAKEFDRYKTEELETLGFKVLRFRNIEVLKNINAVLDSIKNVLNFIV
ncbi:MAG: endonuclease domain-containing protein [Candidatus Uhrbacteria bacterium]